AEGHPPHDQRGDPAGRGHAPERRRGPADGAGHRDPAGHRLRSRRVRPGGPAADPALLVEDLVTCVVQVAGKVRDRLEVPPGITAAELRELALATPGV